MDVEERGGAIEDLESVDEVLVALQRGLQTKSKTLPLLVDRLSHLTSVSGCTLGQVEQLVDWLRRGAFNVGLTNKVVRLLLPTEDIPSRIFKKIVFACGSDTTTRFAIQVHLLRWIVHLLAAGHSAVPIESVYGPLFLLLDYQTLRAIVASILARTTRDHHVTLARIQRLQRLNRFLGGDDALLGLLSVYYGRAPEKFEQRPVPGVKDALNKCIDHLWTRELERHLLTNAMPVFLASSCLDGSTRESHGQRPMTRRERIKLFHQGHAAEIGQLLWRSHALAQEQLSRESGSKALGGVRAHLELVDDMRRLGYLPNDVEMERVDHATNGIMDREGAHLVALSQM